MVYFGLINDDDNDDYDDELKQRSTTSFWYEVLHFAKHNVVQQEHQRTTDA